MHDPVVAISHFVTFGLITVVIFCSIGLLSIKFRHGRWGWYLISVFWTAFLLHGSLLQRARIPEYWDSFYGIGEFVTDAILLVVFFFLTRRAIRKRDEKEKNR